jgi:Zn-dependent peptidase ImmA (M78 family)
VAVLLGGDRDSAAATGTERLEVDANQFAAALLMPAEFLQDADCDVEDEREIEQ